MMREKLKEIVVNAYAPYSDFKVSALVVTNDDNLFFGVNVENASFGGSICAERNAINSAIANGYKKGDFKELYVYSSNNKLVVPCMLCRQTFVELFDESVKIVVLNDGEEKTYTLNELCPFPFNGDFL
jgi:cytidine deaminase